MDGLFLWFFTRTDVRTGLLRRDMIGYEKDVN